LELSENVRGMNESTIAAAYDAWSATYDSDPNKTRELAANVLRQTRLALGPTVIEVGCGTGGNSSWIAERTERLIALDFSNGMLQQARARVTASHVDFLKHDVTTPWPLEDHCADSVIAMLILEHVADLSFVFREAARALRPRGELFLCELHPYRQLRGVKAEFFDRTAGGRHEIDAHLHDVADYVNAALDAGFELSRIGEWRDEGAQPNDPPRILSLHAIVRGR
jgi:malonyl-CoA O-methyltransferase